MEVPFIRMHFKKIMVVLLVLGALVALFYFSPLREQLTSWRAASLLQDAREFADAGNWEEVERTALASNQLEPSLAAARLLTEAAINQNSPQALWFSRQLLQYPDATIEDKALGLKIALDARDVRGASELLAELTPEERRDRDIHFQNVRGLVMTDQVGEAIRLADQPEMQPRDPRLDLMIANALARNPSAGAREEAIARIRGVLKGEDREAALEAIELIYFVPDEWRDTSLGKLAVARFKDDPDLEVSEKLLIKGLEIGTQQIDREQTIVEIVRQYRKNHLLTLLAWLDKMGEFERMVALSGTPEAKEDRDILKLRILALAQLGKWEVLQKELDDFPGLYPKAVSLAMKVMVAERLGNKALAQQLWFKAMKEAQRDQKRNWYFRLAEIAEEMGGVDERMEAIIAAVNHRHTRIPDTEVLMEVFAWLTERDEFERLLGFARRLVELVPGQPVYINNYFFLKAVHRGVEDEDVQVMEALVDQFPKLHLFRSSFSFVLLRAGEPGRALEELEKIKEAGGELNATGQAVKAKALETLGRVQEARKAAEEVDWKSLDDKQRDHLKLASP